jgi:uncharacterized membrane protein
MSDTLVPSAVGPISDPLLFDARLVPHRSLSPTGFGILMAAIVLVSFLAGLVFFVIGAWPVIGFMGLDVLLIYVAFRVSYARARGFETIRLTASLLTVERVSAKGRRMRVELQPYWLRVRYDADGQDCVQLLSHGQTVTIGRFLGPDQREKLATDLTAALSLARGSS